MRHWSRLGVLGAAVVGVVVGAAGWVGADPKPVGYRYSVEALTNATEDVLANDALKLPGGPTYEFFASAMPPLRYVDADFLRYPIALSGPNALVKGRLVSDGSCVNALARQGNWRGETGYPVHFYMGDKREVFGTELGRLEGPVYAEGYLPITEMTYTTREGAVFSQEAFAAVGGELGAHGAVLVKFVLVKAAGVKRGGRVAAKGEGGAATAPVAGVESAENAALNLKVYDEKMEARFETGQVQPLKDGRVMMGNGAEAPVIGAVWPGFAAAPGRGAYVCPMEVGEAAYVVVFTKPWEGGEKAAKVSPEVYAAERGKCVKTWEGVLGRGMVVETPEKVVNDAWRASVIQNFELFRGDQIRYSTGNQYDGRYIGEGGDTLVATALWGQTADAARLMPAQFEWSRKGLEYHQAAFKLQMLAGYFRVTRDVAFVKKIRPMWEKEVGVILKGREASTGMLPREKYCGDIATLVYSLNSNSNCWRALRDMSVVLSEIGETEEGEKLAGVAAAYRKVILAAIEHATRTDVSPPFVPIALSGEEGPHRPIWGSTIGSYWNLMIEYVLGSGVFPAESQTCSDVLAYIQKNGGMCMGIVRARAESLNWYVSGGRMNDLYGTRYALTLLRRDEADRALVSFYGKLAQGFTRGTFIGGEGMTIGSVDEWGRQMYLPPNSAGSANYLTQLRYLLVQDYDLDDDGRAETLRLLFATPRGWLEEGKTISVKRAPTAFGEVSVVVKREGDRVVAEVEVPARERAGKVLLKLRLPGGKKVSSVVVNGKEGKVEGEVVDLSGLSGKVVVEAKVSG